MRNRMLLIITALLTTEASLSLGAEGCTTGSHCLKVSVTRSWEAAAGDAAKPKLELRDLRSDQPSRSKVKYDEQTKEWTIEYPIRNPALSILQIASDFEGRDGYHFFHGTLLVPYTAYSDRIEINFENYKREPSYGHYKKLYIENNIADQEAPAVYSTMSLAEKEAFARFGMRRDNPNAYDFQVYFTIMALSARLAELKNSFLVPTWKNVRLIRSLLMQHQNGAVRERAQLDRNKVQQALILAFAPWTRQIGGVYQSILAEQDCSGKTDKMSDLEAAVRALDPDLREAIQKSIPRLSHWRTDLRNQGCT